MYKSIRDFINIVEYSPPDIDVGDEITTGRFKNKKAVITGFKKDSHNQPVLKTTKGDQHLFKPRITKLDESIPVKPPTDDVDEVLQANFMYGKKIGSKIIPIDQLHGGVSLNDPSQRKRVDNLKQSISSDSGYISRLIVDTDGNVVEGQHRLEALRELGIKEVPVCVIEDLAKNIDIPKLEAIVKKAQLLHSDHLHQLIKHVFERIAEEGSASIVMDDYEAPKGFEKAWEAALRELSKNGFK